MNSSHRDASARPWRHHTGHSAGGAVLTEAETREETEENKRTAVNGAKARLLALAAAMLITAVIESSDTSHSLVARIFLVGAGLTVTGLFVGMAIGSQVPAVLGSMCGMVTGIVVAAVVFAAPSFAPWNMALAAFMFVLSLSSLILSTIVIRRQNAAAERARMV